MRTSLIAASAVIVSLAAAPAASAIKIAPPGNSAVSEYVENVPGAKGNVPSSSVHRRHGDTGALSPSTRRALVSQGSDGTQAAVLAIATAPAGVQATSTKTPKHTNKRQGTGAAVPTGAGGSGSGRGPGAAAPVTGGVDSSSDSVLKAVTGNATHGLGAMLPVILVLSAIGAGLLAVLRRRQRT
jgi:hypothetical protein